MTPSGLSRAGGGDDAGLRPRSVPVPGLGTRYEFLTGEGKRLGVLVHHDGRRSLVVGERDDPDAARSVLLDEQDRLRLVDLLDAGLPAAGRGRLLEGLADVQARPGEMTVCSAQVEPDAPGVGRRVADVVPSAAGVAIVSLQRRSAAVPVSADTRFEQGDTVLVVGTAAGVRRFLEVCGQPRTSQPVDGGEAE